MKLHQVISTAEDLSFTLTTDSVQEQMGFLASWEEVDEVTDSAVPGGNYFISYPSSFIEDSSEKICVELFGANKNDGTIETQVFADIGKKKSNWIFDDIPVKTKHIDIKADEKFKCVEFVLPLTAAKKGLLHLKINFQNSTNAIDLYKEVTILKKESYPLIQTEKGHYKAKDEVKFRILLVDHKLQPSEVETIDEVWIEDSHNRRIRQWFNQSLDRGIMQQEFKLSDESETGTWTIKFKAGFLEEKAAFMVSEYVLPKFAISIKPPTAILRDDEEAKWNVCAKYTHGGSVKGQVKAYFTSTWMKRSWARIPVVKNINITKSVSADDDCAFLTLNYHQIKKLTEKVDKFDLNVEFEEEGTGIIEKSKWSGRLEDEAIRLKFGSSSGQFTVGGFPYVGELDVSRHDGSPREDDIEICVQLFKDADEVKKYFKSHNIYSMKEDEIIEMGKYMADIKYSSQCYKLKSENGKIKFYVPMNNIPKNVIKLNIKATAINHPGNKTTKMKQPVRKMDVSLTHADTDFAISIKDKQISKIPCGKDFKANVYIASQPGLEFDLHYQVISKGRIFKYNSLHISTNQSNAINLLVGDAMELSTSKNYIEKEREDGIVVDVKEIILPINHEVSPSMKLVVFVNDGKQALTDSHTYEVEECQQHEVKGEWIKEKVNPGSTVTFSVTAESDSVCAISATDKSVELLGNTNQVTRKTIGKLQAEIGDRKTSRIENYWEYQRKCPDTYNIIKVAGIVKIMLTILFV